MTFDTPLITGRFLRRYKRFFADVELDDGRVVTAHCPNTGAMTGCMQPGWRVLLSRSDDPRRKLAYTWELIHNGRCWICINTMHANRLVAEALAGGDSRSAIVREVSGDFPPGRAHITREAAWPDASGRCDFLVSYRPPRARRERRCFIEVKSVTLKRGDALEFPDAPSERARRHLEALMRVRAAGDRALLLFLAQRSDARLVRPARAVDPEYADLLGRARAAGVEVVAYQTKITKRGMYVARALPVEL